MKFSTSCSWACVGLLAVGQLCISAQAAELLRGPYLQIPTSESILVRWRTDVPTESTVFYGLETNNLSFSAKDPALTNEHSVRLTGLTPATKYFYSIGSETETLAAGSEYRFVTSPNAGQAGPTRVWAFGDFGGLSMGYEDANTNYVYGELAVRDSYVQYTGSRQTDLWLPLGDNAYWAGTDLEYQTNFFYVFGSILRQVAVCPTIGNHETYSVPPGQRIPYLDIFSFPTNGEAGGVASGKGEYYSFDRANIHFVCLDSMTQSRATNGAMANWLRADLAATTNQWIIAYFHHAPYSKGSHNTDSPSDFEMIEMRQNIVPILEAGGVDLVLSGHSHIYERSYLLHGHYGYSTNLSPEMILNPGSGRENETGPYTKPISGPLANRGTVYVVVGTGCCLDMQIGHHPAMFKDEMQLGSLVFEVNSNRLDALFLRETGYVDDTFTMLKENPRALVWTGTGDRTTWDLVMPNWSNTLAQADSNAYHHGDFVRFDDATTNRVVTLSGILTPSGATVETSNTLTFTGSGSLSGPTGLTKKGVGTLRVGMSNDYSGLTTISNGTLSISGGNAIGDLSAVVMANTAKAALVISNGETIGSLAGGGTAGGNVILNSGTLTTGGNGNSTTFAANLSGAGSLSKQGGGTMTLTGFTLLLGSLWVNAGTLVVDGNGSVSTFNYQSIGANSGNNGQLTLKGSSTFAVADDFNIGEFGDSVGTLNLTNNASLTVTRFFVGAANEPGSTARGTVNQSGGTVTETSPSLGDFIIGGRSPNSTTGVGIYNLSGGALIANAPVSVGGWGSGTVNQSGGTLTAASPDGGVMLQHNSGSAGTYHLNGGTLRAFGITTGVPSSDPSFNSVFNFNGGTLQPTEDNNAFMQALSRANVRDGGAVIDTAGFNISIGQPLLQSDIVGDAGNGGLTKNGAGKLTITGANTYTGNTTVNGGTLAATQPTFNPNSAVTVASGAVLQLDFVATNRVANLVLNGIVKSPGTYDSGNSAPYLTGTGSLLVTGNNP
ncbi:MAG: autotransporter-associated beta strand repeat-containing protein, partial [Verrucomicrobiota bacterium]